MKELELIVQRKQTNARTIEEGETDFTQASQSWTNKTRSVEAENHGFTEIITAIENCTKKLKIDGFKIIPKSSSFLCLLYRKVAVTN